MKINIKKVKLEKIANYCNRFRIYLVRQIKKNSVLVTVFTLLCVGFFYNKAKVKRLVKERENIIADSTVEGSSIFFDTSLYNKTIEQKRKILLNNFDNDHVIGNPDAPVTLIDYSSFSCKYCRQMRSSMNRIVEEYAKNSDKLLYVFRPVLNKKTIALKVFLNCVDDEEKRWLLVGDMFEVDWYKIQDVKMVLSNLVKRRNFDMDMHNECLSGAAEHKKIIYYQNENSLLFDLKRTPFIVVNGKKYTGYKTYDELKEIIEENVKKN
jgi:protein-disulfide isomerase